MRILYIDIDTLRPDHLGCYGYNRDTSPNIDKIAGQGVIFKNYYCSDAPCLPSRTALMSGKFGIHTGVVGHGGTAADMRLEGAKRGFKDTLESESLPGLLRRCGMKTVSISPFAERHSSWSFYAGFSEIHNTGKSGLESAEDISPTVFKWLENNAADDNWFLHINYWDPHTPYRAPAEFGNPFEDEPGPDWITPDILANHLKAPGPHSANEINMYDDATNPQYPRHPGRLDNTAQVKKFFDDYDCGIKYADEHVGRIFDFLESRGLLDDTIIIISSDHGENIGELGLYAEHATADNITCRIPMIIRWPGKMKGHIDNGLHYNLDLLPTLAQMLGVKKSDGWDGESFADVLTIGKNCGRDYLVLSQCAHVCQRSVRWDKWLYMRTYHCGYHLFPKEMLFDIETDPHEQYNLAPQKPDLCKEAVYMLSDWHDQMMSQMVHSCTIDPLWTVLNEGGPFHTRGCLDNYCKRLEQTRRSAASKELRKKYSNEL